MKQTIEIEVPEGKEVIYDKDTKSIKFIDKKPIRSKSWYEFCINHPNTSGEWYFDTDKTTFTDKPLNLSRRFTPFTLKNKEDAEGIIAFIQLIRFRDEWVGDWNIADVEREDGEWFAIKFIYKDCHQGSIDVVIKYLECDILTFPTEELAQEFINCFKDLIEKAKRFI